jgi:DNA-binding ferritin-like protein
MAKSLKRKVGAELAPDVLAVVRQWATRCLEICGNQPRVELSVLVKALQGASLIHHSNHWQSSGPTYYGDHLLFDRIYNDTDDLIDPLAEKAVGTGSTKTVNPVLHSQQAAEFVTALHPGTDNLSDTDMALVSYNTALAIIFLIDWALKSLESRGQLTNGIDNMLQGIADKHEEFVYLLQQRLTVSSVSTGWKI